MLLKRFKKAIWITWHTWRGVYLQYKRSNTFLAKCSFLKDIKKTTFSWLFPYSVKPFFYLLPLSFLIFLSSCRPSVKCRWPAALAAVLLAVHFVSIQLNVGFVNIITLNLLLLISIINICEVLKQLLAANCNWYAFRSLCRCWENKCPIKKEKNVSFHHSSCKLQRWIDVIKNALENLKMRNC